MGLIATGFVHQSGAFYFDFARKLTMKLFAPNVIMNKTFHLMRYWENISSALIVTVLFPG